MNTSWIEGEAPFNVAEVTTHCWDVSLEEQKRYHMPYDHMPYRIAKYVSNVAMCVRKGVDGANTCHGPLLHPSPGKMFNLA